MSSFSADKYTSALSEIRERLFSADILSKNRNVVFIESTALQIRKILELISYLSILVNSDKLNHKERNEWHAQKVLKALDKKAMIFYPLPCRVIPPEGDRSQPTLIPLGLKYALSQEDFVHAYNTCGKILHAQHPFKDDLDFGHYFYENKKTLDKIRCLLNSHVIAIGHDSQKYTFLYIEFDFTNDADTKPTFIREYKSLIFDEIQLKSMFENLWANR